MRRFDDRYARDVRRHDLALRLIRHGVRTQTIRAWTGLTERRVWSLYHSYCDERSESPARRRRGPQPQRLARLMESAPLRNEAAALGGLCLELGLIPAIRSEQDERALRTLPFGERLCQVFELYEAFFPETKLQLEHLILLVTLLSKGEDIGLRHCKRCGSAILIELAEPAHNVCIHCRHDKGRHVADPAQLKKAAAVERVVATDAKTSVSGYQHALFDG